jgi:hypothetical protein
MHITNPATRRTSRPSRGQQIVENHFDNESQNKNQEIDDHGTAQNERSVPSRRNYYRQARQVRQPAAIKSASALPT